MFTVLASALELAGGPLEQQLKLHRTAYAIAAADQQTENLARILFLLANQSPRDLNQARESLRHFRDHARFASRDQLQLASLRAGLEPYTAAFPELATEIRQIEVESLRRPEAKGRCSIPAAPRSTHIGSPRPWSIHPEEKTVRIHGQ